MRHPDALPGRPLLRLFAGVVGACAVALAGCKGDGGGIFARGDDRPRAGDPLLGSRIPPQDLPIPGQEGYASRGKRDPLLGTPTRKDEPTQPARAKAKQPTDGTGVSRAPYLPDKGSTNAALAGHLQPDDTNLSIGDRRPAATPTSAPKGPVPLRPAADGTAGGQTTDQLSAELRKYGAKWDRPVVQDGQYVALVDVPIDPTQPGLVRRYEGAGPTPAAALKQVLDEVRADKGGR